MKNSWVAGSVGFLFALGLGISGMTQPAKVIGFLDIFGSWDPSLAFVMIGAIGVHFFTYRLIRRRKQPIFSHQWHVPENRKITPSLAVGSTLFGIGWGLAGYCPGPALVSLATGQLRIYLFVGAMIVGMGLFRVLDARFKFKR